MSRSRKKNPITKDGNSQKRNKKRIAEKQVRNYLKQHPEETLQGKSYRKVWESWEIADYVSRYTREEAIKDWNEGHNYLHKKFNSLEDWLEYYDKCYYHK